MKQQDKRAFADLLSGLLDIYGRQLTPASAGLWWAAFERYELAEVGVAFSRYTQDPEQGRYPPTPAAVLGCLAVAGSRPSADEAWALALASFDESETVCLTDEMLEAVAVASPVWEIGDTVGARMAFKGAYERIATERRLRGQSPSWTLSLGWDAAKRTRAAQEALRLGRLTLDKVKAYLPEPEPQGVAAAVAGRLCGNVVPFPVDDDAKTRRRLADLLDVIRGNLPDDQPPRRDPMAERERFEMRKREALAALASRQANMNVDNAAQTAQEAHRHARN